MSFLLQNGVHSTIKYFQDHQEVSVFQYHSELDKIMMLYSTLANLELEVKSLCTMNQDKFYVHL